MVINTYPNILTAFKPITLAEMGPVKLMTRWDEKFFLPVDQLSSILETARHQFQVLENHGRRLLGYESLYLDTADHEMYLLHHNGKLNRYKIRIREYKDSNEIFFEVKFKDNHRMTNKKRTAIGPERDYHSEDIRNFMVKYSPYLPELLEPALYSYFDRITLVNNNIMERVTIDINPSWHIDGRKTSLPNIAIIEVKSSRPSSSSGFGYILREARVAPRRFSKYCIGTALLYPELKHNRFKSKLMLLDKLNNKSVHHEPLPATV